MKMRIAGTLFILLIISALQCYWVDVNDNNHTLYSYTQSECGEIELTFRLDGYAMEQFESEGNIYQKISHPESGSLLDIGMPQLPVFTTMVAIPGHGKVSLEYEICRSELMPDVVIYPQEEWEGNNKTDTFRKNEAYYRNGGDYPAQKVKTEGAVIMRDLRVLPVTISPFQYNTFSRNLEICSEINVRISVSGSGGKNEKEDFSQISRAFEPMYKRMILNYEDIIGRPSYQQTTLLFVINDMDDALETLQYLTDWKRQKGFNVVVATTSETGTTNSEIKEYIQDAYDNWENPPEYICFCGDANGNYAIPAWGQGDHAYALLAGDDIMEDVITGRLSFQSNSTFQVLISKIFAYEKYPYLDETIWYSRALLAGDPTDSGPSMIFTCKSVKEMMLDYPDNFDNNYSFLEIYSGSFLTQINGALNNGMCYMVYRGFWGMSGWAPGTQQNGYKMPFATILTCGTGNWVNENSDSEVFMQAGSVSLPSGAIGAIGTATNSTHSCFNNSLTLGIYAGIFRDSVYSMGGALTIGKQYLYSTFPQNPNNYVDIFCELNTLMGDPSLELWTDVPAELSAVFPNSLPSGSNYLNVQVFDAENLPLEGACVTLSNNNFWVSGFSLVNGELLLDLDDFADGDYDLVVTKHNSIPLIETVNIGETQQFVDIESVNYNDEAGNNDGNLNPGESVEIIPVFHNYGSSAVSSVSVTCSLSHDFMTLQNYDLDIGDIAAGESVIPITGIELEISPAALDGMQGLLELVITDEEGNTWNSWHYLNITGADLFTFDYQVAGADILEPGVNAELIFSIENQGSISIDGLTAEIVCSNQRLTIIDSLGSFGLIDAGGSADNSEDTFELMPSLSIIPGSQIELELHFSNESGFFQVNHLFIAVGEVNVTDPLGPDDYGYWAYDDGDIGYEDCPVYEWIEIDPSLNGNGTIINLDDGGDDGDIRRIILPAEFTFSFYGEIHDDISVCSNGWIAPGYHHNPNFMNHPIPGSQGASPMIAAFWDDLNVNCGNVCYYFDANDHYFVVEWSQCENGDTAADETFEIILYDPSFYQTLTDDSLIKIQYKEITNNNAGEYPANHGQFCTVGITNEASSTGIGYTFNNTYPEAAKVLENDMAVFFTPLQYPDAQPRLILSDYSYTAGDDQFIEAGETVLISALISNSGSENAVDIEVALEISNPGISVINGETFIDIIESGSSSEIINELSFAVADTIADNQDFTVIINMSDNDNLWFSFINFTVHWLDAFVVEQDSIDIVMGLELNEERNFTISNASALPMNYYLQIQEDNEMRDISSTYITANENIYMPDSDITWTFMIWNMDSQEEWIKDIWLDFPSCVNVINASSVLGGSGGDMLWDEVSGDGALVNWHGEEGDGRGVLHNGEIAIWSVDVHINDYFASDIQVEWQIEGDGYGNDPHSVNGILVYDFYLRWISLNDSFGTIAPGDSEEITVYFDTYDIDSGEYFCDINILSDSWFSETVEIHLTAVNLNDENENINSVTKIVAICPNPFNPSTEIRLILAENSMTELTIYNIKGQLVKKLLSENIEAGEHKISWNGINDQGQSVSTGMYYLKLKTKTTQITTKMLLLK